MFLTFLHSAEKSRLKSTFLPYHVKKHHSTLEMDTFKVMLLLFYVASTMAALRSGNSDVYLYEMKIVEEVKLVLYADADCSDLSFIPFTH